MTNPWLVAAVDTKPRPEPPAADLIPAESDPSAIWVMGVTGGAGESSVARLHPHWLEAGHVWPSEPAAVLLTARTNAGGLIAASNAITEWAAKGLPHIRLVGLALLADSPEKLPRPLLDLRRHVIAGVDRYWDIGWCPAWRLGDPDAVAPGCERLLRDLAPRL